MDETERLLAQLAPARLPPAPLDASAIALMVAASIGLVGGVCALLLAWRRRRRRLSAATGWLTEAEASLERLRLASSALEEANPERHELANAWLSEASSLARRVALVGNDRMRIAPLTDAAWLQALDALSDGHAFTRGPARVLADGPYRPDIAPDKPTREAVCDALGTLIERQLDRSVRQGQASARPGLSGVPVSTPR